MLFQGRAVPNPRSRFRRLGSDSLPCTGAHTCHLASGYGTEPLLAALAVVNSQRGPPVAVSCARHGCGTARTL
eukprot:3735585-Pleurochrysis_carterae.AAC.1